MTLSVRGETRLRPSLSCWLLLAALVATPLAAASVPLAPEAPAAPVSRPTALAEPHPVIQSPPEASSPEAIPAWAANPTTDADPSTGDDDDAIESEQNNTHDSRPIRESYQDFHKVCDLDGDGFDDVVLNGVAFPIGDGQPVGTVPTVIQAWSGRDGHRIWVREEIRYNTFTFNSPAAHSRPLPRPMDKSLANLYPTQDLDRDGVCDFVAYGFAPVQLDPYSQPLLYAVYQRIPHTLRAISGATGVDIWNRTLVETHFNPIVSRAWMFEVPVSFYVFDVDAGSRIVWITSDAKQNRCGYCGPGGTGGGPYVEHVYLFDAANGKDIWRQDLGGNSAGFLFEEAAASGNLTRVTGATDLNGDGFQDLVLDQTIMDHGYYGTSAGKWWHGYQVLALSGKDGAKLWVTRIFNPSDYANNVPRDDEGCVEIPTWHFPRVLRDATQDGAAEIDASYYAKLNCPDLDERENRAVRTHTVLLDGATGRLRWDVANQGIGFSASLTPEHGASQPLIAVGTVDVKANLGGLAFPEKDVRLTVLKAEDGSPVWSYREKFAQDSFLPYFMALQQFLLGLAPFDWNADGVKDLVTPTQYVRPQGDVQVLLSTATSTYQILSGTTGRVLKTFESWGSVGMVAPCSTRTQPPIEDPHDESNITIITGHSRRVDALRFNVDTAAVEWRQPVYNDPRIYPATIGVSLLFLGVRCGTDVHRDATLFGLNAGTYTLWRGKGAQYFPIIGERTNENGTLAWIVPALAGNPPIYPSLDLDALESAGPALGILSSVATRTALGVALSLPWFLVGRRWRIVRQRRRGKESLRSQGREASLV